MHQENMRHHTCACGDYTRSHARAQAYMRLYIWPDRIHAIVSTIPLLTCGSMLGSKGMCANTYPVLP